MSNKNRENFLAKNKAKFGTHDGLPGAFHRECLFNQIGPQKQVSIVTPHGNIVDGRVVMRGPAGWVLNLGGKYGTPGIATPENTIYVAGASI